MVRSLRRVPRFPIRLVRAGDAARIAELCGPLGYPSTADEVARRIRRCPLGPGTGVFVAEDSTGRIVGWLQVAERFSVEAEPSAEVSGLVVDVQARRSGIGRALVAAAERWAVARGFPEIVVRTNVERSDAPTFYRNVGFDLVKTSHKFRKRLDR